MAAGASEIRNLIQKLAGTDNIEEVEYAIGEVISVNIKQKDFTMTFTEALPINTCQVKVLSSKSISGELTFPDGQYTQDDKNYLQSLYPGLILKNVSLCVDGVGNNMIIVPTVGSKVLVVMSKFQQPYVAQFSNIEFSDIHYGKEGDAVAFAGKNDNGNYSFAWEILSTQDQNHYIQFIPYEHSGTITTTTGNQSYFQVNSERILLGWNQGATNPALELTPDLIGMHNNNSTVAIPNSGKIIIQADNNQKILIQNNTQNLAAILKDLIDTLKTGVDTGGYSFNPATVALLNTIETRISTLFE